MSSQESQWDVSPPRPHESEPPPGSPPPNGNGLAVAALTLGIIAIFFALIPFTFFLGWILGVLALVFGLVGRSRPFRKVMAAVGAGLGGVALAMGVVWVILFAAFADNLVEEIGDRLEECWEEDCEFKDWVETIFDDIEERFYDDPVIVRCHDSAPNYRGQIEVTEEGERILIGVTFFDSSDRQVGSASMEIENKGRPLSLLNLSDTC